VVTIPLGYLRTGSAPPLQALRWIPDKHPVTSKNTHPHQHSPRLFITTLSSLQNEMTLLGMTTVDRARIYSIIRDLEKF